MVEIRRIRATELGELLALYRHLHEADDPLPASDHVDGVWKEIQADPNQRYFGLFADGLLVASSRAFHCSQPHEGLPSVWPRGKRGDPWRPPAQGMRQSGPQGSPHIRLGPELLQSDASHREKERGHLSILRISGLRPLCEAGVSREARDGSGRWKTQRIEGWKTGSISSCGSLSK